MTLDLEKAKIEQISSDYRAKGYDVRVRPAITDVPPFLHPFQPDIVATSATDNVVVDVKSPAAFDPDRAQAIAQAIDSQPRWRFEMSFVSPQAAPDVPVLEELASQDQVNRLLANAEILLHEEQIEAA